jgi:hypothetical protein
VYSKSHTHHSPPLHSLTGARNSTIGLPVRSSLLPGNLNVFHSWRRRSIPKLLPTERAGCPECLLDGAFTFATPRPFLVPDEYGTRRSKYAVVDRYLRLASELWFGLGIEQRTKSAAASLPEVLKVRVEVQSELANTTTSQGQDEEQAQSCRNFWFSFSRRRSHSPVSRRRSHSPVRRNHTILTL